MKIKCTTKLHNHKQSKTGVKMQTPNLGFIIKLVKKVKQLKVEDRLWEDGNSAVTEDIRTAHLTGVGQSILSHLASQLKVKIYDEAMVPSDVDNLLAIGKEFSNMLKSK